MNVVLKPPLKHRADYHQLMKLQNNQTGGLVDWIKRVQNNVFAKQITFLGSRTKHFNISILSF